MSTYTRISPDHEAVRGKVERVAATRQMCCARRDQMLFDREKISSFIRKPYVDMNEAEWMSTQCSGQIQPKEIAGILVAKVIDGEKNSRTPLTQEQFDQMLSTERFVPLRPARTSAQGLGFKAK